jgi:hypothetical protein
MAMAMIALFAATGTTNGQQPVSASPQLTGDEIVNRYIKSKKCDSEMAFIRMQTNAGTDAAKDHRFLVVYRSTADGGHSVFLRMIRPVDVEGITVLTLNQPPTGERQFVYLPSLKKSRELSGTGRSSAFLGSDFTYEDLMEELPAVHVYQRVEDTSVNGRACFVVRAIESREKKTSAYQYRDLLIDQETFDLLRAEFYGQNGKKIKTFDAIGYRSSEIKGQTNRPQRATMRDHLRGTVTEFLVIEGRLNEKFDNKLFTIEFLERWQPQEIELFIFQYGLTVVAE